MSENIFDEKDSFFGNLDISNTTKLGVMAILLGGTYEIYTNANGRKTFVSTINIKEVEENGGNEKYKKTTIMYDLGNSDSLGENAQQAIAGSMGVDDYSGICSGKYSDPDVVKKLRERYKNSYGLSEQGVKDNSKEMINKIDDLLTRQMTSIGPEVVNKLKENINNAYGLQNQSSIDDKKKQMTEAAGE